jgi:uncharacterized protein YcaQ
MPVLSGERPIGRVAPRVDRRRGVLVVEGVFAEAGAEIGDSVSEASRRQRALAGRRPPWYGLGLDCLLAE